MRGERDQKVQRGGEEGGELEKWKDREKRDR